MVNKFGRDSAVKYIHGSIGENIYIYRVLATFARFRERKGSYARELVKFATTGSSFDVVRRCLASLAKEKRVSASICIRSRPRNSWRIFHRDSQQASIVPREPIFQRHLPEGKQRAQKHEESAKLIGHYRPASRTIGRNLIDITARNNSHRYRCRCSKQNRRTRAISGN